MPIDKLNYMEVHFLRLVFGTAAETLLGAATSFLRVLRSES